MKCQNCFINSTENFNTIFDAKLEITFNICSNCKKTYCNFCSKFEQINNLCSSCSLAPSFKERTKTKSIKSQPKIGVFMLKSRPLHDKEFYPIEWPSDIKCYTRQKILMKICLEEFSLLPPTKTFGGGSYFLNKQELYKNVFNTKATSLYYTST